jgi:hypothetical protein
MNIPPVAKQVQIKANAYRARTSLGKEEYGIEKV